MYVQATCILVRLSKYRCCVCTRAYECVYLSERHACRFGQRWDEKGMIITK